MTRVVLSRGQVAIALNCLIATFIVASLGIVCYEMSRILLARDQLKHCVELAALAGETALESTSQPPAIAEPAAKLIAENLFKQNAILGQVMSSAYVAGSLAAMTPAPGQACIFFEFDDPITHQPAALGTATCVLRVYGAYNYPLFSGGFGSIGAGAYTVFSDALAALPALDLEIIYDDSGSMDDATCVTFVRRYWDPGPGNGGTPGIVYQIPTPGGVPLQGPISGLVCIPPMGTNVNAEFPQGLDLASQPPNTCPREFSEYGTLGNTVPLRGVLNVGRPPGDAPIGLGGTTLIVGAGGGMYMNDALAYRSPKRGKMKYSDDQDHLPGELSAKAQGVPPYVQWNTADPSLFTDVVVTMNPPIGDGTGNAVCDFSGYTGSGPFGGFNFPTIGSLVEAYRGNLESAATAALAQVSLAAIGPGVVPTVGYQDAYRTLALASLQPKASVDSALMSTMQKLLQSCDVHFGFVTYNDYAGLDPTTTITNYNVSWTYPIAGTTNFPLPKIPLNPGVGQTNFAAIRNWLQPFTAGPSAGPFLVPMGGTNVAQGLQQALADITSANSRRGAMKAILLITDGVPTRDLLGNAYPLAANIPAFTAARTQALNCGIAGVPIFCIGLDQTGGLTPFMTAQFDDNPVTATGIIGAAGHGGVFHVVTWCPDPTIAKARLVGALNNQVRQMVNLIRD